MLHLCNTKREDVSNGVAFMQNNITLYRRFTASVLKMQRGLSKI